LFLKTVNTGIMDCSGSWLGLGLGLSAIEAIGRKEKKAGAEGWEKWEREEWICVYYAMFWVTATSLISVFLI
jgi:hypothetical protein